MTQLDEHGTRILAFVEHYQRQHHRSPTYREIGAAVGLPSNDHVARDLRRLVQQGYLSFTPGVSRSIVLLKTPRARVRSSARHSSSNGHSSEGHLGAERSSKERLSEKRLSSTLPLPQFGSAGARSISVRDDASQLAAGLFQDEQDTFLLRAHGDAMRDAMLADGDLVVVKRSEAFCDGDLLAIYLKQSRRTTLRHLYRENGRLRLQAPHPDTPAEHVRPSELAIRGTVLAIVRKRDM